MSSEIKVIIIVNIDSHKKRTQNSHLELSQTSTMEFFYENS